MDDNHTGTNPVGAPRPEPPATSDTSLLQAHLAEYQMLTTRVTYLITMQFGLWTVLILSATLLAQLPPTVLDAETLTWGVALVVEAFIVALYASLHDQYISTQYIERELRPRIIKIVGHTDGVWGYETYLRGLRRPGPQWWERLPLAVPLLAIVIAIVKRMGSGWRYTDWAWLASTVAFLSVCFVVAILAIRVRLEFTAPAPAP